MKPVSDAFLSSVRGSQVLAVRVRAVEPGQTGTDPAGVDIGVQAGDVRLDATADIHATLDLATDGTGWETRPGAHILQPYGTELHVSRGTLVGDEIEYASLGYFRINRADQEKPPDGPLRIDAADRMVAIIEGKLEAPRQFKANASISSVFDTLVREVLPQAVIEFDDPAMAAQALGRPQIIDQDRFEFLRRLAHSYGKVMRFDHRGILTIASPPSITAPVFDVTSGDGGVLVESTRSLDREGVFNGVVYEGEAAGTDAPPVRAFVWDANPESPTYYHGPFGKVPEFYSSSFVITKAQAADAARVALARVLGLPHYADLTAVPNPALEPFDPIRVRYADHSSVEVHIIDQLTIPLTADQPMIASTRDQTAVLISEEGIADALG